MFHLPLRHTAGLRASSQALCAATGRWPVAQSRRVASDWQVSSYGRVKSSLGVDRSSTLCGAYRYVQIAGEIFYVHRLVAAAFLGPAPCHDLWQVNHIDGDPFNNRASNLQYVTPAENVKHFHATCPGRARSPCKAVFWRPAGTAVWSKCSSQKQAADFLHVNSQSLSRCCHGLTAACSGNGIWYEFKSAPLELPPSQADEVWLPATYPGYVTDIPGLVVSSHGRVCFQSRRYNHVTYGHCMRTGYYKIKSHGRQLLVHRLGPAAFLGQPDDANKQVNHKDKDRGNNHVFNLEYVTPSQNVLHALRTEDAAPRKRKGKAVLVKLTSSEADWTRFESMRAAGMATGVSERRIPKICLGQDRSFVWEFRFPDEHLDGEEWLPVVLEGARTPKTKT